MRKLFAASAVVAVSIGLLVAPGASAVKAPKQVFGTVSVFVVPNPVPSGTTIVTASGNVKANSSCRKDRDVLLTQWVSTVNPAFTAPTGVVGTVETGPKGDYSTPVLAPPEGTWVLEAFVDDEFRKVGSKKKGKRNKKGRQFNCMEITGQSPTVTVLPPAA